MKQIRLRLTVSYVMSIMALGLVWFAFHKTSMNFYPSPSDKLSRAVAYTDAMESGFSEASLKQSADFLTLDFNLHSGSAHPYAVVAFPLGADFQKIANKFYDLSVYDSVSVVLRTARNSHATVSILTSDPMITRPEVSQSSRILETEIPASRSFEEVRLPLSAFVTPEWWYDRVGIKTPDNFQYLNRALQVRVSNGRGGLLGFPDQIEIKSLRFYGERDFLKWGVLGIFILCTSLYVAGLRRLHG